MKYLLLCLLFLIGIFLQTYIIRIPFVVGTLITVIVLFPEWSIFLIGCVAGIILDIVSYQIVGGSSIFFTILLGLIFLYSRKFEMQNPVFVGISIFIGSLLYGALFIHKYSFWGALLCAGIFVILYTVLLFFLLPKKKNLLSFNY